MFKGIGKECNLRSSEEAIQQCGLNWNVYKGVISHTKQDGKIVSCPKFVGVFREDNNYNLGIVGSGYSLVQNIEAASIADSILDEEPKLKIIHGVELFNGDKIFLTLQLGDPIEIGNEFFKRIIMVSWAHNGKMSVSGRFLLIRNSTGAILNVDAPEVNMNVKVQHSGKTKEKIKIAKNVIKNAYQFFENVETKMDVLAVTPMTDGDFKGLLSKLFPDSESESTKGQTRTDNKRNDVFGLYRSPSSSNLINTKLGGLMALTEYCNSSKSTRVEEGKDSNEVELNGLLFGTRTKEINEGFKLLLDSFAP